MAVAVAWRLQRRPPSSQVFGVDLGDDAGGLTGLVRVGGEVDDGDRHLLRGEGEIIAESSFDVRQANEALGQHRRVDHAGAHGVHSNIALRTEGRWAMEPCPHPTRC